MKTYHVVVMVLEVEEGRPVRIVESEILVDEVFDLEQAQRAAMLLDQLYDDRQTDLYNEVV